MPPIEEDKSLHLPMQSFSEGPYDEEVDESDDVCICVYCVCIRNYICILQLIAGLIILLLGLSKAFLNHCYFIFIRDSYQFSIL